MRTAILASLLLVFGLVAAAQAPVPRPSKEFTVVQPDGKQIMLSSLKGKVVVVQFLLTTCPHCQAMSQMLTKLQNEYGSQGFQALGVASFSQPTPNAAVAAKYVKDFKVGFPVGYSDINPVLGYLGLSVTQRIAVPQVVIIDKKGQVRAQSEPIPSGEMSQEAYMRDWITKLLKEK